MAIVTNNWPRYKYLIKSYLTSPKRAWIIGSTLIILLAIPLSIGLVLHQQDLRSRAQTQTLPADIEEMINKINDASLQTALRNYLSANICLIGNVQQISLVYKGLKNAPIPNYACELGASGCSSIVSSGLLACDKNTQKFICGLKSQYSDLEMQNVFNCRNQVSWLESSGSWDGDWDAVNDATSFGPSLLYRCAAGTSTANVAELVRRANKTVDYEISLIDEVINTSIGVDSGGYCWLSGYDQQSCDIACRTHGGICGGASWNDSTTCSIANKLASCSQCLPRGDPGADPDTSPDRTGSICKYRSVGNSNCLAIPSSGYRRLCACQVPSVTVLPDGYCLAPDYEGTVRMLGGAFSLITARSNYTGTQGQKVQLYSRGIAIGSALALIYDSTLAYKSPMGAVLGISGAAFYNLSLAEISTNPLEKTVYTLLGKYLITTLMEPYWVEDTYGGYYKSIFIHNDQTVVGPLAFEQGFPFMAGGKLLKLDPTSHEFIYSKLQKAFQTQNSLWDSTTNGFKEGATGTPALVKMLSSNHLLARGMIYFYDAMKVNDPANANYMRYRADLTLNFINNNMYWEGLSSVGENDVFFSHDTAYRNRYCTGCNFATLEDMNLLYDIYHPLISNPSPTPTATPPSQGICALIPTPTPTPTPSCKSGDVNCDRVVNMADIGIIVDNYGSTAPFPTRADLNGDGVVNIIDVGLVVDNYGL